MLPEALVGDEGVADRTASGQRGVDGGALVVVEPQGEGDLDAQVVHADAAFSRAGRCDSAR